MGASFFLILKTQEITQDVFICPSTQATRGFATAGKLGVQDVSNWPDLVNNMSYSYNTPFPQQGAVDGGWKFNGTVGSDFPVAADKNPGATAKMANGDTRTTNPGGFAYNAGKKDMATMNSNNHNNEGQEVLYCDGHVDWQPTPFCGAQRNSIVYRDNIFTPSGTAGAGVTPNFSADGTGTSISAIGPGDAYDTYLLPTQSTSGVQ